MTPTERILAGARAQIEQLRDEARGHDAQARDFRAQMTGPANALRGMEAEEAELVQKLAALRGQMIEVRKVYDDLDAKRGAHVDEAKAAAAAADYYEQHTLPGLTAHLAAAPAHAVEEAHARTGLPVHARPVAPGATLRTPDEATVEQPAGAIEDPDALNAGGPLTTLADLPTPDTSGPRHEKPKPPKSRSGISGAFKTITGRVAVDEKPDDQDGDS